MDNNIDYKYQSGFHKNDSADTSLSYLTEKILTSFDSGLLAGMILIDLQKAFDAKPWHSSMKNDFSMIFKSLNNVIAIISF